MQAYHIPVLRDASVKGLVTDAGGAYMDATFGGGGHSRAILECLSGAGQLFAFDQDPDARANAPEDSRFTFIAENFRYALRALQALNAPPLHGILADLGVSSHQFDAGERGFSFRADAPLDMRMNKGVQGNEAEETQSAADLVNEAELQDLTDIFRNYGELPGAYRVAQAIVRARPIRTTGQLAEAAATAMPARERNSLMAQLFQALRISVNDELGALKQLLTSALPLLATGGRLVVISYHSLEDRLVKHFMASGNLEGHIATDLYGNRLVPFEAITRKPIVPDDAEIAINPRARSAKLRIAQKK